MPVQQAAKFIAWMLNTTQKVLLTNDAVESEKDRENRLFAFENINLKRTLDQVSHCDLSLNVSGINAIIA